KPRAGKNLVDDPKLFLEALKALFVRLLEVCKASNFERQSHSRPPLIGNCDITQGKRNSSLNFRHFRGIESREILRRSRAAVAFDVRGTAASHCHHRHGLATRRCLRQLPLRARERTRYRGSKRRGRWP